MKSIFASLPLNQLIICAYIKVGIDNKDIADATHTEINTVKKPLIEKKMKLAAGDNIRNFLIGYA